MMDNGAAAPPSAAAAAAAATLQNGAAVSAALTFLSEVFNPSATKNSKQLMSRLDKPSINVVTAMLGNVTHNLGLCTEASAPVSFPSPMSSFALQPQQP
jgi:hypothetical protein